jgi:hypothetical protein
MSWPKSRRKEQHLLDWIVVRERAASIAWRGDKKSEVDVGKEGCM